MTAIVARRILAAGVALAGVSLVMFILLSVLPGDPVATMMPPNASAEDREALREFMGLDKPIFEQYLIWIGQVFRGDLGHTYILDAAVSSLVIKALGATAILAIPALTIALVAGVALGTIAGFKGGRRLDRIVQGATMSGMSIPDFWLALLLVTLFAAQLRILPASGMYSAAGGTWDLIMHMIIPVTTLAVMPTGIIARATRSAVREMLGEDWVELLRVKGLRTGGLVRHVLKNSAPAILTVMGLQVGYLLGGSVAVESIYAWPGLGQLLQRSIADRDILVTQSSVLVIAILFILANLITDLLIMAINPRVRGRAGS